MSANVISVKESAKRLGVGLRTAYLLFERGELDGYRVGRRVVVYADSVSNYQHEHRNNKGPVPAGQASAPYICRALFQKTVKASSVS
jgi:excisionase family DNA binding protein